VDEPAVGPYRVLGRLGAGGMGEVLLAHDPRLGRQVALKRLVPALTDTAGASERLLREARAIATLNHTNIAVIYDVIDLESHPYIVMEYVPGE
jgi:serine/threonine protein kinase